MKMFFMMEKKRNLNYYTWLFLPKKRIKTDGPLHHLSDQHQLQPPTLTYNLYTNHQRGQNKPTHTQIFFKIKRQKAYYIRIGINTNTRIDIQHDFT